MGFWVQNYAGTAAPDLKLPSGQATTGDFNVTVGALLKLRNGRKLFVFCRNCCESVVDLAKKGFRRLLRLHNAKPPCFPWSSLNPK